MQALLWRDYLCPWCYLGRDRTGLIEALGVEVVPMSYELHPEIPTDGKAIRPGGRLDRVLDQIAIECGTVGLPMRKPTRSPNTRLVLEVAEVVRASTPAALRAFDDGAYRVHWVDGGDLGDADTVRTIAATAGADVDEIERSLADGTGADLLEQSMQRAREQGVTATPAWWIDERLVIPGVQPRETVERWVTRLVDRAAN